MGPPLAAWPRPVWRKRSRSSEISRHRIGPPCACLRCLCRAWSFFKSGKISKLREPMLDLFWAGNLSINSSVQQIYVSNNSVSEVSALENYKPAHISENPLSEQEAHPRQVIRNSCAPRSQTRSQICRNVFATLSQ